MLHVVLYAPPDTLSYYFGLQVFLRCFRVHGESVVFAAEGISAPSLGNPQSDGIRDFMTLVFKQTSLALFPCVHNARAKRASDKAIDKAYWDHLKGESRFFFSVAKV